MVCIYCGNQTKVVNSRKTVRANQTWRRRECTVCGAVFTTNESIDFSGTYMVRAKDTSSSLAPFQPEKLLISLYDSLKHRNKPAEDASAVYHTVMTLLVKTQRNEASPGLVKTATIRRCALDVLKRFDTAAATYYAAFHPDE